MADLTEFIDDLVEESQTKLYTRTYDESGNPISEWDEEKGWFEHGTEQLETGEWVMKRVYHHYTEEQFAEIELEKEKAALLESKRALTLNEVAALFIKQQVNTVDIPDQTSLRMMDYYPTFEELTGQTVKMGFKFTHNDKLYKTIQPDLTILETYIPGEGTESLYTRIDFEHTGAVHDPIPYDGNMELFEDKYYIQNEVIYVCIRNTGAPIYHALSELIGLYVTTI